MRILKYSFPYQNITPLERVIRIALGLGLLGGMIAGTQRGIIGDGVTLFLVWALVLGACVELVITGAIGYCPLYKWIYFPWARRDGRAELAGPHDAEGIRGKRLGLLAFAGDSAAVELGLTVENAVRRHGPIPLWLDRPLDIAPELGLELRPVDI